MDSRHRGHSPESIPRETTSNNASQAIRVVVPTSTSPQRRLNANANANVNVNVNAADLETCGFVSGKAELPLTCQRGQICVVDTENSLLACCHDQDGPSCAISTRCLDRSQSDLVDIFGSSDMLCDDVRAPYCKTDLLGEDTELDGYSLFICDTDKITETVLRYISTSTEQLTPFSSLTTAGTAQSHQSTTDGPTHALSTPTSVIVGAVVGSIGGLAAVVAGILLIRELNKKTRASPGSTDNHELQTHESRPVHSQNSVVGIPTELPHSFASEEMHCSPLSTDKPSELPVSPLSPTDPLERDPL